MEPASFFAASRVVIVAGKGGVGKTVVACALARAAATAGMNTLLVEVDGRASAHRSFGTTPLEHEPRELLLTPAGGRVCGRSLSADRALIDYLSGHGMGRLAGRLERSGALEVVATATPGLKDLLVLGKIKQIEAANETDLIVVDAPASGHAVSFLRAPSVLVDLINSGPIHTQATQAAAMLRDPKRCQVLLVTIAEETPVTELIETAYTLEDDVGVALTPVVVNAMYPHLAGLDRPARHDDPSTRAALAGAAALRQGRRRQQLAEQARLKAELPLEQLVLPFVFSPTVGVTESELLADALIDAIRLLPAHAMDPDHAVNPDHGSSDGATG